MQEWTSCYTAENINFVECPFQGYFLVVYALKILFKLIKYNVACMCEMSQV